MAEKYQNQGFQLYEQQKYKQAEEKFQKAIKQKPDFSFPYNFLGAIYRDYHQNYQQAEIYFLQAIQLKKDYQDAYKNIANLQKNYLSKYKESEQNYKKAIELQGNDYECYFYLGLLYQEKLNQYQDAELCFKVAIWYNKDYELAYYYLAYIQHYYLENFQEAEKNYLNALNLKQDDYQTNQELANLYNDKQKNYQKAEIFYKKSLEYKQDNDDVCDDLGLLYQNNLNQLDQAEKHFLKAIQLDETNISYYKKIGWLYGQYLDDFIKSENYYLKSLQIQKQNSDINFELATIYSSFKKYELAEKYFKLAIQYDNQNVVALNNYGFHYQYGLKQTDQALIQYQKALDINNSYTSSIIGIGYIYLIKKQYQKAEQYFNKVIAINKDYSSAYVYLGIIYEEYYNQYSKAEEQYKIALKNNDISVSPNFHLGQLYDRKYKQYLIAEKYYLETQKFQNKELTYQKVTSKLPFNYKNLGQLYLNIFKNFELSLEYFQKYKKMKQENQVYNNFDDNFDVDQEIQNVKQHLSDQQQFIKAQMQKSDLGHINSLYDQLEIIDQGQYGIVYKVKCKMTQQIFAMKKTPIEIDDLEFSSREFENMLKITYNFKDSKTIKIKSIYQVKEEDNHFAYIIMDLAQCTLSKLYQRQKLNQQEMLCLMKDTLQGLLQLKFQKIIHRDIKPDNILYMQDKTFRLADFGTSRQLNNQEQSLTLIGTPAYFPPEIQKYFKGNSIQLTKEESATIDWYAFDIYSLGLTFVTAICQIPKISWYKGDKHKIQQLLNEKLKNEDYDPLIFQIIALMTSEDQKDRPSAEELLRMLQEIQQ